VPHMLIGLLEGALTWSVLGMLDSRRAPA